MGVVSFLAPHIKKLSKNYNVSVWTNTEKEDMPIDLGKNVIVENVAISRKIDFKKDLIVLFHLFKKMKCSNFTVVHTLSPKVGLLGMIVASFLNIPIRIHSFTGQVWANKSGIFRWFLKLIDKLIAFLTTNVLVDSNSQFSFLINEGVISKKKSKVLGAGSISGVDLNRFKKNVVSKTRLRSKLGTPSNSFVFLYVGRLNFEKGVLDLAEAFNRVCRNNKKCELWVVGPDEEKIFTKMKDILGKNFNKVKRIEMTSKPQIYMQASDILCLPSYREGFGSSVIEAAACGVPSLVSRIYGLEDAVIEGYTGWMHVVGDVDDLSKKMKKIMLNQKEVLLRGNSAMKRTKELFCQKKMTKLMEQLYKDLINEKDI